MLPRSIKSLLSATLCLILVSRGLGCPYVLLSSGSEIQQGQSFVTSDGIVTVQQFGGNFQIYTGEVGSLDCLLYETGAADLPSNDATYRTKLQGDGNLITTRKPLNGDVTTFSFVSGSILLTPTEKFLIITCDGNLAVVDSLNAETQTVIWTAPGNGCTLPSDDRPPTAQPSSQPSSAPSVQSSLNPSVQSSSKPSLQPSAPPSSEPSSKPSLQPSRQPSAKPSSEPTSKPSLQPSTKTSAQPSSEPTWKPSLQPSTKTSAQPSSEPSSNQLPPSSNIVPSPFPSDICQRTVLLTQGQRLRSTAGPVQRGGVFLSQGSNGNFKVIRGTPQAPGETLWESCFSDGSNSDYYTALQGDSQFITRLASNENFVWRRDSFSAQNPVGEWELALECGGGDFDRLVITDTRSTTVAWRTSLFPECDIVGSCPTAVELLSTNEQIDNGVIKEVGNGIYSLEQQLNGNLRLWKGGQDSLECVLWQTFTFSLPSVQSYTIMQADGNLVTYSQPSVGGPFISVFESNTLTNVDSYFLMIDNCSFDNNAVAITRGNPITDPDSQLVGWAIFGDCTARRQRHLRGDIESTKTVSANATAVFSK